MTTTETALPWLHPATWTDKVYVGGWRPGTSGELVSRDPSTGATVGVVGFSSPDEVAEACRLAAAAQPAWAACDPQVRAGILTRAGELLTGRRAEIVDWLAREAGCPAPRAEIEISGTVAELQEAARLTLAPPATQQLAAMFPGQRSLARRVPLGVVGVISPWNAPLLLAFRSLAPARALGNTVVLKADPETPVSGGVVIQQLLLSAGLPADVLHVVFGGADVGDALVTDPHTAMISFTGSTQVGRIIGRNAGGLLKRVALELGGNNAFIVLEDADIEAAATAATISNFMGQGQGCICAGRHLVHEDVVEEYTAALVAKARSLPMGPPAQGPVALGPLINARQHAHITGIVADSVAAGAELLTGGPADGLFFGPTVLGNVRPGMRAFDEETFGPVAPIISFATDEEAVELANLSDYGLTAAVHSASLDRAGRIAARLEVGMVHINDITTLDAAHVPFSGIRASGNGAAFGGPANVEQFTHWRWTTANDKVRDLTG